MSHIAPPFADPLSALTECFDAAVRAAAPFPDAMTLATATRDGRPSARVVLYKGQQQGRIAFVTNYESRKARELADNPRAALVFFWPSLQRQLRFEGTVARADEALSDAYFKSRDRESQLGAWASAQSRPIASREELEAELEALRKRFGEGPIERPPHWGMYLFEVESAELWISGEHRLHDRFSYQRSSDGWSWQRLAP